MAIVELGTHGKETDVRTLIGRDREQLAVREVLDSARAGVGAAVVVHGAPGMGLSALLDWARDEARDLQVLSVVGVEAEAAFPFAGLHRLLIPLLDRIDPLPAHHADALDRAFGRAGGELPGHHRVALAVLALLADAGATAPVVCVVDDAQWLDTGSSDVLGIVARRVHTGGVALIVAEHPRYDGSSSLHDLPQLELTALHASDATRLVHASASSTVVDPFVADQIAAICAGCPLAIVEATRSLTHAQLSGADLLPVVPSIATPRGAYLERRLRALPSETRTLLLIAAADPEADADTFRIAAGTLDVASGAIDAAIDEGLVDRDAPFRFSHPLIRFAVYAEASAATRRRVHRALATAIDPAVHVDRHALHLAAARSEPGDTIARLLDQTARAPSAQVGFAAQAHLRTRAADLTTDPAGRATRLLDAAEAALTAGLRPRAAALARRVEATEADPLLRARRQRLLGALADFTVTHDVAASHLRSARALEELDLRLARDTYAEALQAALISGPCTRGTSPSEVAAAALGVRRPGPDETTVVDDLLDGLASRIVAGTATASPCLRRAVDALCDGPLTSSGRTLWSFLGQAAVLEIWDPVRYRTMLRRLERDQRQHGDLDGLRITLLGLCRSELWAGDFTVAGAHGREAAALSLVIDGPGASAELWASLRAELTAWQGDEDTTRAAVAMLTGEYARSVGAGAAQSIGWLALTTLELSVGRYRDALAAALVLFDTDVPPDATLVLPDLVEAAVRSGEVDVAHEALARLVDRAECSGTEWALGLLARCRAMVADSGEAEARYEEAIERLGHTVVRTDHARAHLLYGEWLRREKRKTDARMHLGTARALFERMGAAGFEARARAELEATGAHARQRTPERSRDLTPQEEHIARRAAIGDTNAEIAEQLYISPRTVDYHLRKVYRKLGIRSRRELRRRFPSR